MPSFHKDKATGKYHCDFCNKEFTLNELTQPYSYFAGNKEGSNEHRCKEEKQNDKQKADSTYIV